MRGKLIRHIQFSIIVIIVLLLPTQLLAQETPVQNYEVVRNGNFILGNAAWFVMGSYSGPYAEAARDRNGPGLNLAASDQANPNTFIIQQLYLPTRLSSGKISMDYRIIAQGGAQFGGFNVYLASTQNNQIQPVATLLSVNANNAVAGQWQKMSVNLNSQQLAQISQLRQKGLPVYIYIALQGVFVNVHVDNVSFIVSGGITFPPISGRIAFTLNDTSTTPGKFQIWSINPNGTQPQMHYQAEGICRGIDWKKDRSAMLFSSSQEKAYSRFSSDIFELRGSKARKVTNPPSHSAIQKSRNGRGTISGKISNRTDRNVVVAVYVEGASKLEFVSLGAYPYGSHTQKYVVKDVVDMGSGQQYICAREGDCVWHAALGADVVPGRNVTGGDIYITGTCVSYTATSPKYSAEGKSVYYAIPDIQQVPLTGGVGSNPAGWRSSFPVMSMAVSPVDSTIVYEAGVGGTGLWAIGRNATNSVQLFKSYNNAGGPGMPSWLSDGSGIVFVMPNATMQTSARDIYYYHLANRQHVPVTQLYNEVAENPCPSPDSKYIVFERVMRSTVYQDTNAWREIWVMQADNPAVMWPLVRQGDPKYPNWR